MCIHIKLSAKSTYKRKNNVSKFRKGTIQFIQYTIQIHVSGELFTPFLFCFVFVVPMINVAKFIQFAAQKKT